MRNPFLATIAMLAALSSCAPRPAPPAPPSSQPQAQPPAPIPPPPPAQWVDSPLSPGDWSYRGEGASSAAIFGTAAAAFTLRCEPGRRVTLALAGAGRSPLIIRTSYGDRSLAAEPRSGALVAALPASDGLLDQIAFSRGRFAVEAEGAGRLVLPAWPETARVIEDCRG